MHCIHAHILRISYTAYLLGFFLYKTERTRGEKRICIHVCTITITARCVSRRCLNAPRTSDRKGYYLLRKIAQIAQSLRFAGMLRCSAVYNAVEQHRRRHDDITYVYYTHRQFGQIETGQRDEYTCYMYMHVVTQ